MSRPTAIAEDAFQFAMHELAQVKTNTNDEMNLHVRAALSNMAYGLKNLSVGLRATYMLLEEVQKDLRPIQQPDAPTLRCNGRAARELHGQPLRTVQPACGRGTHRPRAVRFRPRGRRRSVGRGMHRPAIGAPGEAGAIQPVQIWSG